MSLYFLNFDNSFSIYRLNCQLNFFSSFLIFTTKALSFFYLFDHIHYFMNIFESKKIYFYLFDSFCQILSHYFEWIAEVPHPYKYFEFSLGFTKIVDFECQYFFLKLICFIQFSSFNYCLFPVIHSITRV